MTGEAKSWFDKVGQFSRGHLATQIAVLLPVLAIAGLAAWITLSAPTRARSPASEAAAPTEAGQPSPAVATAAPEQAAPAAVDGLKISSQSWRRGGLGSRALVTFTLRNSNDYAVKDIEIACAFSRQDGSHLTDRKKVIPDAVVNMKSRKTFARLHVGYININANKAKCAPIAANRI